MRSPPTPTFDILVVGEINPDIVVSDPDPVPVFGEVERIVDAIRMTVGSSSAIFACGAARLELRVAFCGVVGDDAFGRFMLDAMAGRGIDVSACIVDPDRPTGATVILSSGSDRAMLTAMGTIGALDVDAVPDSLLDRARHLHSGGFFLQEASRRTAAGVLRGGAGARPDDLVRYELGPERPMGRRGRRDAPGSRRVSPERRRRRAGSPGSTMSRRRHSPSPRSARWDGTTAGRSSRSSSGRRVPLPPGPRPDRPRAGDAVQPIDTTGAGDSFDAGFLRAWLDGGDLRECLDTGAPAGRSSTGPGRRRRRPGDARRRRATVARSSDRRMTARERRPLLFVAANPSIDRLYEVDRLVAGEIHRPPAVVGAGR